MDIDVSTIVIVVIAISFFAVPIYIDQKKKKKQKEIEKQLLETASAQGVVLDKHDIWGDNYAIGISKRSKKLMYLNNKLGSTAQIIDLKQVNSCKGLSSYNTNKKSENQKDVNDTVYLILRYKSNDPDLKLEFYNSDNKRVMQNERNLADKWAGYIKANL